MRARTWRWLRVRIRGLLAEPDSRLWRVLHPEQKEG